MSNNLKQLIDIARKYREENNFSADEQDRQVRSFAYGNTHLENEHITKQDIDCAVDSLRADRVESSHS